ncbi:MAG: hypothetical protein GXP44_03130 [bacterium]|nr:hypothetical protein [bacterium]
MKSKPSQEELEALKFGMSIYAPICLYLILKELSFYKISKTLIPADAEIKGEIKKLYGVPFGEWPPHIKEDWYKLSESLPLEQIKKISAEVHYFLIYSMGALSSKYLEEEGQTMVLDFLYDIFNDRDLWNPEDPTEDCFSKYRKSPNTFTTLIDNLGSVIAERDPLLTTSLAIDIAGIPKFFLAPAVDKIFAAK